MRTVDGSEGVALRRPCATRGVTMKRRCVTVAFFFAAGAVSIPLGCSGGGPLDFPSSPGVHDAGLPDTQTTNVVPSMTVSEAGDEVHASTLPESSTPPRPVNDDSIDSGHADADAPASC